MRYEMTKVSVYTSKAIIGLAPPRRPHYDTPHTQYMILYKSSNIKHYYNQDLCPFTATTHHATIDFRDTHACTFRGTHVVLRMNVRPSTLQQSYSFDMSILRGMAERSPSTLHSPIPHHTTITLQHRYPSFIYTQKYLPCSHYLQLPPFPAAVS